MRKIAPGKTEVGATAATIIEAPRARICLATQRIAAISTALRLDPAAKNWKAAEWRDIDRLFAACSLKVGPFCCILVRSSLV
jgi:hypothetical protein